MDVTVDRSLGPDAVPELVALYETYDWWDDRDETELRRALAATDEAVALREASGTGSVEDGDAGDTDHGSDADAVDAGDLVAAARVLTDYTYYAMVYDVIVREDRRGEGLGEALLAALVAHPPLSDVSLSLAAREGLVPFYESCGFEDQGAIEHPDGSPEELRFLAYRRDE